MSVNPRENLSVRRENALLVKVILGGAAPIEDPLVELAELARSAGANVVSRVVQRRPAYHPASCVGKGKLEEIRQRADVYEADVVIFDNDLSPSQIREIEKATGRKVLDRSELILDIFASRARTREARLQVELAQLEYTAPRLRGMWTHLERIAGAGGATGAGVVGGIGTRGPGESQIEIDRRLVDKRVALLKRQLEEIDRRKVREVRARQDHFTVSLVGYTNAGKSTLMNALTNAGTLTEDRLFATLDTLTRRWDLGSGRYLLLSDTVGFIRDLPHHLVASFRATLEEAIHADLLLHVVDAANPEAEQQVEAVERVLAELEVADKPTLLLLNKADAVRDLAALSILRTRHPQALLVSARSGDGLDELRAEVDRRMRGEQRRIVLSVPAHDGKALGFLERFADVLDRRFEDGRAILEVAIAPRALNQLHSIAADIRHAE
ncbi:MAG TPA: GTPase HflX [Phycisphaerae bacterium]|nr:GTPase HflX [Phycisphaerae bacterium]HQL53256.1 GTPase HflX [Phycisphaerae bacterium]